MTAVPGAPAGTPPDAPPRRWLRWVVYLVGAALFAFVLSRVSWNDAVVLADGSVVTGEIVRELPRGDAPQDAVELRLDDGSVRAIRRDAIAREDVGDETYAKVNEGILRIVRRSDVTLLALGLASFGLIAQIGVWRWLLLLRAQGIRLTFWTAHRLTFLGFFFNNVVPGGTGGDVVKAIYVARGAAARRTPAVITVVVDRVLGLIALALIALVALVQHLDEPKYRELSVFIVAFLGAIAAAGIVFFSRRVRRALRIEEILARLPLGELLRKADEAVFAWRGHKGALLVGLALSFANQICFQGMTVLLALGLHVATRAGEPLAPADYMIVLPVAFIVSSIPALPGSWGVREAAFAVCFHFVGVDRNPAVALSVLGGMVQLFWSLLGGVYFVLGRAAGEFRTEPGADGDAADPAPAAAFAGAAADVPPDR